MSTKELIKKEALRLFNQEGFRNITLRDIAKALGKSYGNITYHFGNKELLITDLYGDMLGELMQITSKFKQNETQLFQTIFEAPKQTFQLSLKYLFLYVDYVEIRRNYVDFAKKVDAHNQQRKQGLKYTLVLLQQQGWLRADLDAQALDYLMELSGAMRTFFFIKLQPADFNRPNLAKEYVTYVNQLLLPYLSEKGLAVYHKKNQ